MHYTPSNTLPTAFHNPPMHTTNTKHSWQNGTRCRDGVNVLWCRSHLVRLVFERSIPNMRLFSFGKLLVTCYTLRLVTISKMHCPSNCETSTVGLSPSPAVIRAEPIVLNILMCQYMSRQDWSRQTKETVYPPLFFPTLQMGKNSVPPTLFPHLTDGEKQCTPHSFSPPYRWGERVDYTLFLLQYGGNLKVYPPLFFPIVIRWRKRVYPLHSFSPS